MLYVSESTTKYKKHWGIQDCLLMKNTNFVDDSAMIIKIDWQHLLVCVHIEEIYGVWLHEKRLIWAVTFSLYLFSSRFALEK